MPRHPRVDLLPHLEFDMDLFLRNLDAVHPDVPRIRTSARTGEGIEEWAGWLTETVERRSAAA